ncbi:hypothetical protein V5O48_008784 [Marasmius crinis-equi]|uniref:Uncharacterized protein n=1 Tax=Marasmius crinis-equi TaxID=585013 RepID=A0ABR3FCZ4_9AGAR
MGSYFFCNTRDIVFAGSPTFLVNEGDAYFYDGNQGPGQQDQDPPTDTHPHNSTDGPQVGLGNERRSNATNFQMEGGPGPIFRIIEGNARQSVVALKP